MTETSKLDCVTVQGTVIVPPGVLEEVARGGRRHLCCQNDPELQPGQTVMVQEKGNEEMELLAFVQFIDRAPAFGLTKGTMAFSFLPLGMHVMGERGEQLAQTIRQKKLSEALSPMGGERGKA